MMLAGSTLVTSEVPYCVQVDHWYWSLLSSSTLDLALVRISFAQSEQRLIGETPDKHELTREIRWASMLSKLKGTDHIR